MKKSLILSGILCSILLVSCEKTEIEEPAKQPQKATSTFNKDGDPETSTVTNDTGGQGGTLPIKP